MAMTTSTESKESRPRSSENLADGVTLVASTLSKFLTTVMIRSDTSDASRKVYRGEEEKGLSFVYVFFCVDYLFFGSLEFDLVSKQNETRERLR